MLPQHLHPALLAYLGFGGIGVAFVYCSLAVSATALIGAIIGLCISYDRRRYLKRAAMVLGLYAACLLLALGLLWLLNDPGVVIICCGVGLAGPLVGVGLAFARTSRQDSLRAARDRERVG